MEVLHSKILPLKYREKIYNEFLEKEKVRKQSPQEIRNSHVASMRKTIELRRKRRTPLKMRKPT